MTLSSVVMPALPCRWSALRFERITSDGHALRDDLARNRARSDRSTTASNAWTTCSIQMMAMPRAWMARMVSTGDDTPRPSGRLRFHRAAECADGSRAPAPAPTACDRAAAGCRQAIGLGLQPGQRQRFAAELNRFGLATPAAEQRGDREILEHREMLNGSGIWNERPRPARQRAPAAIRVMSSPSSTMRPRSGRSMPVIRLNSVDLPAPFGPMMPSASPRASDEVDVAGDNDRTERFGDRLQLEHHPNPDASIVPISSSDLHLPAKRNLLRLSVLGDDHFVLVAVEPPLTADQRRLGDVLRGERRHLVGAELRSDRRWCRAWWHRSPSPTAAPSVGSWARFSASTATSNSECTKPIGWVHCLPEACS